MSKRRVQEMLNELLDGVQSIVKATLKEDGISQSESQYQYVMQKLNEVDHAINGIEESDIRVSDASQMSESDEDSGYPEENFLLDKEALLESAEKIVQYAMNASEDLQTLKA